MSVRADQNDNYVAAAEALDLSREDLVLLARNSFEASLLEPSAKATRNSRRC